MLNIDSDEKYRQSIIDKSFIVARKHIVCGWNCSFLWKLSLFSRSAVQKDFRENAGNINDKYVDITATIAWKWILFRSLRYFVRDMSYSVGMDSLNDCSRAFEFDIWKRDLHNWIFIDAEFSLDSDATSSRTSKFKLCFIESPNCRGFQDIVLKIM